VTSRAKTLTAIALATLAMAGGALAWLYTRPVMTVEEIEDIRRRARALAQPSADLVDAGVAPPTECRAYVRRRDVMHGFGAGEEVTIPTPAEIESERDLQGMRRVCAQGLAESWDYLLPAPDMDTFELSEGGLAWMEDAEDEPEVRVMEVRLRTIWSLDSLVRSGASDLRAEPRLGLERVMQLPRIGSMTPDEAAHVREMLAHVREHHPHRLHRPELFALTFLDESPSEEQDEALDWVCRERIVVMAEALEAIECEAMTTRAFPDRVNEAIDALDRGPRPEWTPLLPPRLRRDRDATCAPLTVPLRELARRAVISELAFLLFDELIAHSLAGSSLEAAMARPAPVIDGELLERRLGVDSVVFVAPAWIGRRGEAVLSLHGPFLPSPPPTPPVGLRIVEP